MRDLDTVFDALAKSALRQAGRSTMPSGNMSSMRSRAGCAHNRCLPRMPPQPTIRSGNCLSDAFF
jgi:hypothetical protein